MWYSVKIKINLFFIFFSAVAENTSDDDLERKIRWGITINFHFHFQYRVHNLYTLFLQLQNLKKYLHLFCIKIGAAFYKKKENVKFKKKIGCLF